jgi:hypothetical protein
MEWIAMKFRNMFVILALLVITLAPSVLAEDDDIKGNCKECEDDEE